VTRSSEHTSDDYTHLDPVLAELAALPEGDPRRTEPRDKLVTEFLPVAQHIARRFGQRGEPHDDLVQVATVGLISAIDRFDPSRGSDFLSFAVPTIMGEVRRHFRDTSWSVRVPRRLKELHLAITSATNELSQHLGRAPTPSELATHLGISRDEVFEGLEASNAYRSSSLDELLVGTDKSLSLGDDDPDLMGVENREALQPLLRQLPERERTIILLRFFGNLTQTQIADRIGVSQMHVSRLLSRTLVELRKGMLSE
jgi:RNA polymerase sigma-B factor